MNELVENEYVGSMFDCLLQPSGSEDLVLSLILCDM